VIVVFPNKSQQMISLAGQTLAAITANESLRTTPVVFIHGITSHIDLWEPTLPEPIRNGRRWISLSLPGHHPSPLDLQQINSRTSITPAIWAEWYEQALWQLVGDEPVDVVGWSTGGFTGLTLAAHYPQRIRRLMSISGFASGRWLGRIGLFQQLSLNSLTRAGVRFGFGVVGRSRWLFDRLIATAVGDRSAFRDSPLREPFLQASFRAFANHDPRVITELFQIIAQFDASDSLANIPCPTLICGGEADPYIPASQTQRIAALIPNAELVLWPQAGHLFCVERTREYQELLTRWLDD
jgi:pimeloyl-ACP methyl ester carboxylesterase